VALPDFDEDGDLPVGVHRATLAEVLARFGQGTPQRQAVTARFLEIYRRVQATGKLERLVIFGSYVTDKAEPNDVDIILVMHNGFRDTECEDATRAVFSNERANAELGASIFWTTPSGIFVGTIDDFLGYWQITRNLTHRGIVEVTT